MARVPQAMLVLILGSPGLAVGAIAGMFVWRRHRIRSSAHRRGRRLLPMAAGSVYLTDNL
jgi:hypothetical protein